MLDSQDDEMLERARALCRELFDIRSDYETLIEFARREIELDRKAREKADA